MILGDYLPARAMSQKGKPYRWGAEASAKDPDPPAFDCSELVEWTCGSLGVTPKMPDGARFQYAHCEKHGKVITIDKAMHTPGALLFRRNKDTQVIEHVAISRGTPGTIEARGKDYGVGTWPHRAGWTDAALVPGVEYP